jgi:hypothetical protein
MRVLQGMEVQVLLNDVVGIMDLPFPDNQPLAGLLQDQQSVPVSGKSQAWSNPISPASNSTDDASADDLFSWNNELKLALCNVKNNIAVAVTNSSTNGGGAGMVQNGNGNLMTTSGGRKRKIWDEADSPVAKVPTSSPQGNQQLSLTEEQQLAISEQLIIDSNASKLVTRYRGSKDPLSEEKDKLRKQDVGE